MRLIDTAIFQLPVLSLGILKAGPWRFKQIRNNLKMKPLPRTSVLYLIFHASVIPIVGLQL